MSKCSSLSLAITQNPRKHGVFGGFLMLMTNPMTNDFCRLKTPYVTFFVMNFVMENRESGGEILTLNPFIESEMIHIVYRNLYKNRLPIGLGSLAEGVNRTLALLRGLLLSWGELPPKGDSARSMSNTYQPTS